MLYHSEKQDFEVLAGIEYRRSYNVDTMPDALKPTFHCWYKERVLNISDDLPKFSDTPEVFGGTGKMMNSDGTPIEG
jgi:hypothetical protein